MASRFGLRPDELIKDVDGEMAEKILREKEINSGIKYDQPSIDWLLFLNHRWLYDFGNFLILLLLLLNAWLIVLNA